RRSSDLEQPLMHARQMGERYLDLADQVQGRSQGLLAFFPLGRANFAWVGSGVLGSLQLAQSLAHVTSDLVGVNFDGLDHAFRVDDEGAAQGQAFFSNVYAESVGQLMSRVADQRELSLANGRGSLVPNLVGEVSIGSDAVHCGTGLLQLGVAVGSVFKLGRAVEGESCRHEDQYRPRALQGLFGDFDELAVVESVDFKRLDLGVDQRHLLTPFGVQKLYGAYDNADLRIWIID